MLGWLKEVAMQWEGLMAPQDSIVALLPLVVFGDTRVGMASSTLSAGCLGVPQLWGAVGTRSGNTHCFPRGIKWGKAACRKAANPASPCLGRRRHPEGFGQSLHLLLCTWPESFHRAAAHPTPHACTPPALSLTFSSTCS